MSPDERALLENAGWIALSALVVGIAVAIIQAYRRRLRREEEVPVNLMDEFRDAYEAGELDDAEFHKVKLAMARRELLGEVEAAKVAEIPPVIEPPSVRPVPESGPVPPA